MTTPAAPARLHLPVEDTRLAVTDTGGPGRPVVYLNGSYADQKHWRRVIADLGDESWRHITYDERARGASARSSDYSFEACLRDLDAVLTDRGVHRPVLVGWSYGAGLAVHWAARHPDRVAGVVCVDGGVPYGLTGPEGQERIRKLFRRLRWLFPVATRLGLAARMSAADHAEINIEINEIGDALRPVLERVSCPVRYVLATGGNLGGGEDEMGAARAALEPVLVVKPNMRVSAQVASNHSHVLRKDASAVATAVRGQHRRRPHMRRGSGAETGAGLGLRTGAVSARLRR